MKFGGFVTYGFATIALRIAMKQDNLVFASSSLDIRTDPSLFKRMKLDYDQKKRDLETDVTKIRCFWECVNQNMTAEQCQAYIEDILGGPNLPNHEIPDLKIKIHRPRPPIWLDATYWMIGIPTNIRGEVDCDMNGGAIRYPWTWTVDGVSYDIPEVSCLGFDAVSCCDKVMAEIEGKGIPLVNDEGKCLSCWVHQEPLEPIIASGRMDVVYLEHMAAGGTCTESELSIYQVNAVDAGVEAKLVLVRDRIQNVVDEGNVLCSVFQDLFDNLLLYGRAFPRAMSRIPQLLCGICEDPTDTYELTSSMKVDLLWIKKELTDELKSADNAIIIYTDKDGYVMEPPKIGGSRAELDYDRDDPDCQDPPAMAPNSMPTPGENSCPGDKLLHCECEPDLNDPTGACACPSCVCPSDKEEDADGNCVCPSDRIVAVCDCPKDEPDCVCPDRCSCPAGKIEIFAPCWRCPEWMGYCSCPSFCVCEGDKVEDVDGNCVCSDGKVDVDGVCVCPPGSTDGICSGAACPGDKLLRCGCEPDVNDPAGTCACPSCVCPSDKEEDADGNCVCSNDKVVGVCDCPKNEPDCICPDICTCPADKVEVFPPCARCPEWMGFCRCQTFCVCEGDKVEDSDGNCVCPDGKSLVDGVCVDEPCSKGTIPQPDGSCLCPKGMSLDVKKRCVCDVGVMNQEGNGCVEPVDACPSGTSYDEKQEACISCNCGFCPERSLRVGDWEDCCSHNPVDNNCHSSGRNSSNRGCNFAQSSIFYPGYSDQKGDVCGGVEVKLGAQIPVGCGCKPNSSAPCTYSPQDESRCFVCSVEDLADNSECSGCRKCLADKCDIAWSRHTACIQMAGGVRTGTAKEWENCLGEAKMRRLRGLRELQTDVSTSAARIPSKPKDCTLYCTEYCYHGVDY